MGMVRLMVTGMVMVMVRLMVMGMVRLIVIGMVMVMVRLMVMVMSNKDSGDDIIMVMRKMLMPVF